MVHPTIFGKEAKRKAIISISVFVINLFVCAIIVVQYLSGLDKEDTNEWEDDTNPIIERIIKETLEDTIESVEWLAFDYESFEKDLAEYEGEFYSYLEEAKKEINNYLSFIE